MPVRESTGSPWVHADFCRHGNLLDIAGTFSLVKLLVILITMMAAGAGALHSWHKRNLFIEASLLSEAFSVTSRAKLRVSDYYVAEGVMPHDNASASLPPPQSLYGANVKRVSVGRGGTLIVDFADEIGARSMVFTPLVNAGSGLLSWSCSSDSIDPAVLEKLEQRCNYLPATLESELMRAITDGDNGEVRSLLSRGAAPDQVINGNTPLMLAAKTGDVDMVRALLDAGAHVDNAAINVELRTPLMVAIAGDKADIAGELLARGASLTRKDFRGKTALDHAMETDQRLGGTRYSLMVSAAFNPQFAGRESGNEDIALPPEERRDQLVSFYQELWQAAQDCHVKRIASLLAAENDLESPEIVAGELLGTHIRTPACRSALQSHIMSKSSFQLARDARFSRTIRACERAEAERLLRRHPEIDPFQLFDGVSHLDRAVAVGCTEIVTLFIRERDLQGSIPDSILMDALGETPRNALVPMIGTLLAAGADMQWRSSDGSTVLGAAIGREQPVVAKVLIDSGADVNTPSADGSTPLIAAAKKGYDHLVRDLINEGADLDRRDSLGRTALIAAVASENSRVADLLIRAGADPGIRDNNGVDALVLLDRRDSRRLRHVLGTGSSDF